MANIYEAGFCRFFLLVKKCGFCNNNNSIERVQDVLRSQKFLFLFPYEKNEMKARVRLLRRGILLTISLLPSATSASKKIL
jgi:hypothetical protein